MINFKRVSRYDINIRHTANAGCVVTVGCFEAAFSTPTEMLKALVEFYKDPEKMEKEYGKISGPQNVETNAPRENCTVGFDTSSLRAGNPTPVRDRAEMRRYQIQDDGPNGVATIDHPGNN